MPQLNCWPPFLKGLIFVKPMEGYAFLEENSDLRRRIESLKRELAVLQQLLQTKTAEAAYWQQKCQKTSGKSEGTMTERFSEDYDVAANDVASNL
jgi:cell division septum initiation protein DivIVA